MSSSYFYTLKIIIKYLRRMKIYIMLPGFQADGQVVQTVHRQSGKLELDLDMKEDQDFRGS